MSRGRFGGFSECGGLLAREGMPECSMARPFPILPVSATSCVEAHVARGKAGPRPTARKGCVDAPSWIAVPVGKFRGLSIGVARRARLELRRHQVLRPGESLGDPPCRPPCAEVLPLRTTADSGRR